MSILDRDALSASPLADLHALASELSIDGYRRLRKADLIDAILTRQGGEPTDRSEGDEDDRPASRRRRGRRGGRARSGAREDDGGGDSPEESAAEEAPEGVEEAEEPGDGGAGPGRGGTEREEEVVEGEVELLPNGTGFLRVNPPEPSKDDVYVSAAQVKRCELVPGDRISGPRRPPRRSERFASLIRVNTINGRPADEVADSTRFEDLPAAFPSERFRLGSDDPTIKAIEWLTPFGQGSRVTIAGPARAGKTEALRRLAEALAAVPDIQLSVALSGVRPEEIAEWQLGPVTPAAAISFAASADEQAWTIERVVDQGRRLAARGSHAVVLIDTLGGLQPHAARKLLAAARNVAGGGSLTVIATAPEPLGGETTVIALDPVLASTGRYPALDLLASWTIRAELLVGQAGAEAIARARSEALEA
jgi:transcription termination factor Rho